VELYYSNILDVLFSRLHWVFMPVLVSQLNIKCMTNQNQDININ